MRTLLQRLIPYWHRVKKKPFALIGASGLTLRVFTFQVLHVHV